MPSHILRLTIDRLAPGAGLSLGEWVLARVCFVAAGAATCRAGGAAAALVPESAWLTTRAGALAAGGGGATVLRYELFSADDPPPGNPTLEAGLDLDDAEDYLLRCDTVALPPGGTAYAHTHQGGGIRCLLEGGFNVRVHGETRSIDAFDAWFEAGPDPVLAWAPEDRPGRFNRVMILPRRLRGKSSIRYLDPEDASKPKPQRYTVLLDEPIAT